MDQLNQHSGISLWHRTAINHPSTLPTELASSPTALPGARGRELSRCAALALRPSLCPGCTTSLYDRPPERTRPARRSTRALRSTRGKKAKPMLLSPGSPSDKKPQEMFCIFVCQGEANISMGAFVTLSIFKKSRQSHAATQMTARGIFFPHEPRNQMQPSHVIFLPPSF